MRPVEVFISHSSRDRKMAKRLAETLVAHGIPVFYSPRNIIGAQQWQDEILKALQRCDWFVVILSPAAVESMWVRREIAFALNARRLDGRIVPLAYRRCDMASVEWLGQFQRVDFSGEFAEGCRDLLRIWGMGLKT
jgi:hypothetical protein